jgi:septum formation protein
VRITAELPLVLGSASPRRRELLELLGVPFVVRAADVDEGTRAQEKPDAYLERVAQAKLEAVRAAGNERAGAILVADTTVVAPGDHVLGKPTDDADAAAMLAHLAGATHEVKTRFLIASPLPGPALHGETVTTRVSFRALSSEEIDRYVATGEGRDKAGSYAVQGRAAAFVSRIEGSYTAVVGLPLCEVAVALRRLGSG